MEIDDPEINLSIPVKSIYNQFLCPICSNLISECTMASCSHNFCKGCIVKHLNTKNQCPCCNTILMTQQLSPNKHFDRMIAMIQSEKEKASKLYFQNLLKGGGGNLPKKEIQSQELSPIEQLFQTHMKRSLSSYEEFYQKLKSKYDSRIDQIRIKYSLSSNTSECDAEISQISESFEKSVEMLRNSYDEYMKHFTPAPQFLPVTLNIQVPSKNIQFPNVHIGRTDTGKDVKNIIRQKMEKRKDPVVDFEKANIFLLINGTEGRGGTLITDDAIPIAQYHPEPGALLVLQGHLTCRSDAPKQCFKQTFVKDSNLKMDYYTCKDCKYNWICKSCVEVCHKGHNISDYIHDHAPTWACCYCAKNGKCKLGEKK